MVERGTNGNASIRWEQAGDSMMYFLRVIPWHAQVGNEITFSTTDTAVNLANLSEGLYYTVMVKAKCSHQCPNHSVLWSDWSESVTFYLGDHEPDTSNAIELVDIGPLFTLSPNPATGMVTVEIVDDDGEAQHAASLQIVNLEGSVVAETMVPETRVDLDVSGLTPGVYLVRLSSPKGTATRKLTVAR